MKSIAIPNSVTYIGWEAFKNTAWYENQTEGVVYAGKVAYGYKGTVPNSLVLQEGTLGIAADAFFGCRGLSSVEIPSGVVEIGRTAFYGTNLKSITLPNSVTRIGGNAFDDTPWYRESTPWYGGLLYASNILYRYKGATPAETTITLRDGTTGISIYAFMDYAKSMVAINIPNSVSWIGDYAFNGCISLASINISKNVTSIGEMVFGGCDNLRNIVVDTNNPIYDSREDCNAIIETQNNTIIAGCSSTTIPHSITSIGNNAFEYHRNLVSIAIPYSITEIGDYAFRGCSALTSIVSEIKNPFRFGTDAFSSISTDCTLTVPYGTKDSYIAAGWTEDVFKGGIVEAPYNPTSENTLAVTDAQVLRGRQIVLPVSMSNTEDITAIQFDLTLPAGVSIAKNSKGKYIVEKTERCADHTLSASKPGEANMYKVLLYSTEVESITGNEGAVINVTLEVTEDMEAGDYEVRISNINLTTTAEKKITPADATCVLTVRNSIPGDANGDGSIDVTDIVAIANSILGHASESFDDVAADVNGDGSVDVTDIVVVANIILHDGGANAVKVREAMQMLDPQ